MSSLPQTDKTTVAVITGGHEFDVPGFHGLIRSLEDADCYIQHLEDFVADTGGVRAEYDVLLFYTMPTGQPPAETESEGEGPGIRAVLESLGSTSQGVFVLHHGLVTYQDWPFWSDLVGMPNREISEAPVDVRLRVRAADPEHPISRGMADWDLVDEPYPMAESAPYCQPVLTVDHPHSLATIAWTHTFGQARVFCLQPGHDIQAFGNPHFRRVVARGVQWCAGRL